MALATWIAVATLVFHFVGYPVLVWLGARWRPRPVDAASIEPRVTLIIAAFNEAAVLPRKIDNALALDYPADRLEVMVVTDGSSDDSADIVTRYADRGVLLLHDPVRAGKSAAINRAVDRAAGEILVFSDANAFYRPDALRMLVRNFNDPSVGAVSGCKTVVQTEAGVSHSEGTYWKYESLIKRCESRMGSTAGVVGEILSVRRELFRPIERGIINDDMCIMLSVLRQGYRVIYEPLAVSWEVAAQSMTEEATRRRRMTAGRFQFLLRPGLWPWNQPLALVQLLAHKFLRLLLPLFMVVAFGGSLLGSMLSPGFALPSILLLQCIVYVIAFAGSVAERRGWRWRVPIAIYYVVRGCWASAEGLWRLISGRQTVLWDKIERNGQHAV